MVVSGGMKVNRCPLWNWLNKARRSAGAPAALCSTRQLNGPFFAVQIWNLKDSMRRGRVGVEVETQAVEAWELGSSRYRMKMAKKAARLVAKSRGAWSKCR